LVGSSDHARAIVRAVNIRTWVNKALVANSKIALVTDAQGLIVSGHHTVAIVTATNSQTWVNDALVAISKIPLVADTQGLIGSSHHTRAKTTAYDACTGRIWHHIYHALGPIRVIARATVADGGIIVCNDTGTVASTYHSFTRVVHYVFLANASLQGKSLVTDADWPLSSKGTSSMVTTVDSCTCVGIGNAIVAFQMVAIVAET
jgi:hypothetical protein